MNNWNFQELHETPSQTGGPYVHIGLLPKQANIEVFENNFNNQLVKENTLGERIRLEGQVFDGLGLPILLSRFCTFLLFLVPSLQFQFLLSNLIY